MKRLRRRWKARLLAQLVYATTDPDFADSAITAMRAASIPCYRVGHGYSHAAAELGRASTESQICIYIERDIDFAEANRILVGLGAAVEQPPPAWLIALIMLAAALIAVWVGLGWIDAQH
jgi:hypothetical protein